MKKFLIPVVAFAAFLMVSCSSNPGDKAISMIKDYTAKMEKASSVEEIEKIGKEMQEEFTKLGEGNEDFKPTEAQAEELAKAMTAFEEAATKKATELAGAVAE